MEGPDTTPEHSHQRMVVHHNYYFAKPGKAEEVYAWRVHASDVRAELGLPPGRVLRRFWTSTEDVPDVIWELELPESEAMSQEHMEREKALGETPEFQAVMQHMGTLARRFERARYTVEQPLARNRG